MTVFQKHICIFQEEPGPRTEGEAHIGGRQGRGIVGRGTDEGNFFPVLPQFPQDSLLLTGRGLGKNPGNTGLLSDAGRALF